MSHYLRGLMLLGAVSWAWCAVGQTANTKSFILDSAEQRFQATVGQAEAEVAKVQKAAGEARIKAYRDRLAEVTKTGDFDKAVAIKARIEQLEQPAVEAASKATSKRPRPKDTVSFDGHTYALIKDSASWHVAKRRCEDMGGYLACLETAAEGNFVRALCGNLTTWVGGTDEEEEGTWVWCHGGTPVRLDVRLDNGGNADHYLALYFGIWHDGNGGSRYAYVCEWDNDGSDR